MMQLLFSAQPMVLIASTIVCISPTPFSVQDSWDTLQCQLGQLAFGSMKLPACFSSFLLHDLETHVSETLMDT
jgi:hypothetical protein